MVTTGIHLYLISFIFESDFSLFLLYPPYLRPLQRKGEEKFYASSVFNPFSVFIRIKQKFLWELC